MRSVGIPARVAGVPHWVKDKTQCPDGDASPACGNHDWVEAWADGAWHVVDPLGSLSLDQGWFLPAASKQIFNSVNHSVYVSERGRGVRRLDSTQ